MFTYGQYVVCSKTTCLLNTCTYVVDLICNIQTLTCDSPTGQPDQANFRALGDCLLWTVFFTEEAHILGYFLLRS
jgi:hypothetical protein